ncbi:hypothetical protein LWI28_015515 [Acer negundo]|uniref:Uncharacterized protein n=1 Tax=Acer negundo TaxID=4023 RepID=A0AAD5ILX1_ACENE|nr:hypothetical protein LWI28_015515 [Acer negundo]
MLLCDDQYIPEVYVSAVEKVSAKPGHVIVPTVQPIYQTFLQQLAAQISSVGGSNNVLGSIPTTDPSFDQIVNPIIPEDQTIDEVVTEPYNEDDRSILEYNPHSEYGLDDFDEDYIGHSGSREGVNDEPAPHHGIGSDPTYGGGCIGPAIKVAMAKEYPEITHGLCGFHMNINLKNIFKIQVVCNLFYEASRAHRESEFLEKI